MSLSLQVIYPVGDGTEFDHSYYAKTHMALVHEHIGAHISSTLVTRGLAGGPNTPAGFHAIASIVFPDQPAMDAAMGGMGPLLADVPNFTNVQPTILIGDVIG